MSDPAIRRPVSARTSGTKAARTRLPSEKARLPSEKARLPSAKARLSSKKAWLPNAKAWPEPAPPAGRLLVAALAVGLLGAAIIPGTPAGLNVPVFALAVAVAVALGIRRDPALRRGIGRVATALSAVAFGLSCVAAVRASDWLVWGCIAASATLGAAVALDVRRWNTVLLTGPLFLLAMLRSLLWSEQTVRAQPLPRVPRALLNGLGIGVLFTAVIGALLASADAGFADLLSALGGLFAVDLPFARLLVLGLGVVTVLTLGFAATTRIARPRRSAHEGRPAAEWLTPLLLVTVTIGAFLVVEAARLFGGPTAGTTHAARAREGFGQLIVVTVLVLALLGWAGASASSSSGSRRLLGAAGGLLLTVTLLLGVSALRRLWLYQDEYGWTVTRLNAGAFELWVAAVLPAVAVAWLVRRADLLPRLAAGSAGLGLLIVALAGPDAVVANLNVHRYERTQEIDLAYLSRLSVDAAPALAQLPPDLRACLVGRPIEAAPWYGWNLARAQASRLASAYSADQHPSDRCTADTYGR